jgi:prepilin-type N-terminal cleavage/methylation domain-containing protein
MMSIYKKYTRDNAGFSFAELMVVIALIGVLSAIALPNLLRSLPEKRVKNAARNLYADMQKARLLAVKENKKIFVKFETDTSGAFYYFVDASTKDSTQAIMRRNLSEDGTDVKYGFGKATKKWDGSALPGTPEPNPYMSFNSTGGALSRSAFLENQNQDVCYAVTATDYGAVTIRRFNGSSWDED